MTTSMFGLDPRHHLGSRFAMPFRLRIFALPAALLLAVPAATRHDDRPLRGFTTANAKLEREWETKFRAIPEPARMREAMRRLSLRPHHVGSPYDKDNAEWLRAQYASYGFDATIERFDVLPSDADYARPRASSLPRVSPRSSKSPPLKEDPTSNQKSDDSFRRTTLIPADGDVTAPLVYVNYGVADGLRDTRTPWNDFGRRARSLAIGRYGGLVARHQAKGRVRARCCSGALIYSDPRDDGRLCRGRTYPPDRIVRRTACSAAA